MMDKLVAIYDKFLQIQQQYKNSEEYRPNRYYIDLLHLASDANHLYVEARSPTVKEICRVCWQNIDAERMRIRQISRNDPVTQQATSPE